jgi:hypothetical protein
MIKPSQAKASRMRAEWSRDTNDPCTVAPPDFFRTEKWTLTGWFCGPGGQVIESVTGFSALATIA